MEENKITLITKTDLIKRVGEEFSKYIVQVDGTFTEERYFIHVLPLIGSIFDSKFYTSKDRQGCLNKFKEYARAHFDLQYRIVNISNSNTDFQEEIYNWLVKENFDVILTDERIVEKIILDLPFGEEEI